MNASETYPSGCGALAMLTRIANRWSILALLLVAQRPHRFNELRRAMGAISQKMLSQTLKGLERDGLVNRKVTPTVPVTVEYSITELGASLVGSASSLWTWSDAYFADVVQARARFDLQHGLNGSSARAELYRASA
uniref:Transcriptional regulator, HxlR family n=1 Tax=Caulobacter sp. (strain K31) TaxID=366602 RepID=B0T6P0_CAUSK